MKNILKLISDPYKVILEKKSEYIIWFLFTIVTGQIGIIANYIVRSYTHSTSFAESIHIDSLNGSFYTFSIALVASILGPLFINFINSKALAFRTLKTFTIIIAIFFLFIAGVIYSAIQSRTEQETLHAQASFDWTQFIIFVFSIFFVSYGYCILGLERSNHNFDDIDDPLFSEKDDEKVEDVIEEGRKIKHDANGIEL
ncbi:MAG: hypothetical protein QE487_19565 [Fluviicola sp.]|nr:hypothetical protein [Fluviicola sp.]